MVFDPAPATKPATTDPSDPTSLMPPPPPADAAPGTTPPTTTTFHTLPYLITRTPSNKLPVYEHSKGGGTKHITVVRKLTGDLVALQEHLRQALELGGTFQDLKGRKKEYITINWTTRQIVIRGWRGAEISKWLELAGF
jgi:large subunit ribosomal protein L49